MTKNYVVPAVVGTIASIIWTGRRVIRHVRTRGVGDTAGARMLRSTFWLGVVAFFNRKVVPRAADTEIAELNRRKIMREFGLLEDGQPEGPKDHDNEGG